MGVVSTFTDSAPELELGSARSSPRSSWLRRVAASAVASRSRSACSTIRSRGEQQRAARDRGGDACSHCWRSFLGMRMTRRRSHTRGVARVAPTLADSMTPRHFLTGAELTRAELDALLDRALELKRAPLSSQALDGPQRRADLREALDAHARVLRGRHRRARRPRGRAALRRDAALARRGAARHRARALPARRRRRPAHRRRRDPRGARRAQHGAGHQHAERAPPPLPGARRPADAARGVRRARRRCASRTSATATTSRARSRCSARSPGCTSRSPRPPGYALEDDLPLPAGASGALSAATRTRARRSRARARSTPTCG